MIGANGGEEVKALKSYIERHGLSQQQLADIVGLNQATVSKHLRGKGMRLETAMLYHRKLGIPIEELLPPPEDEEEVDA
jgi:transcriptional regulator with XRE-family HTH domain